MVGWVRECYLDPADAESREADDMLDWDDVRDLSRADGQPGAVSRVTVRGANYRQLLARYGQPGPSDRG